MSLFEQNNNRRVDGNLCAQSCKYEIDLPTIISTRFLFFIKNL